MNRRLQALFFALVLLLISACGTTTTKEAGRPTAPPSTPLPTPTAQPAAAQSNLLRVHFVDVGQGDAILIQGPDGTTALIDGGDTNTGIVQYLKGVGVQKIDMMIATHPHADHIGGLVQVLKAIPVARVITNGEMHTTITYEHFLDAIASAGAEYAEARRGDLIPLGSITLQVLHPLSPTGSDMNQNSLVLRFSYGKTTFLMMGDAGKKAEAGLLAAGLPLKADILKVGHHGSLPVSLPAFLEAVGPSTAVYSAGVGNPFQHPARSMLAALRAVGAKVYGTDKDGTIVIDVDVSGYTVGTAKAGAKAPVYAGDGQPGCQTGSCRQATANRCRLCRTGGQGRLQDLPYRQGMWRTLVPEEQDLPPTAGLCL